MNLRRELAANADLPDYRAYRWRQLLRHDYTPDDCTRFHDAVETVVVPAAEKIYVRRRQNLGVETLRPWDIDVDPLGRPPLQPFSKIAELEDKGTRVFAHIEPQFAAYFDTLRRENLLDLDSRKGKMPSAYCAGLFVQARPFVFMNAVGTHEDVLTLLHECGHAFHVFEDAHLPYHQQLELGTEFHELASITMELLAAPHLTEFYSPDDLNRVRVQHLENMLLFWPYCVVVDAFQHWVYTHHDDATDPAQCDAQWAALWVRFMPGVDWSGLETYLIDGWRTRLHIHQVPFYYLDYGLAQLGAVQIGQRAQRDLSGAVRDYRRALALGGTASLPELYAVAGAKLAFDAETLRDAVTFMQDELAELL
jgi:oligoendopeptidase F